jgi:hypothetical protein
MMKKLLILLTTKYTVFIEKEEDSNILKAQLKF